MLNEKIYKQRVGHILDIYMQRTEIEWENIKFLILKNKHALSLLEKDYVEFANAYQAANKIIGITLMRDVSDSDLESKIGRDEEDNKIIELLKNNKFEFIKPSNYLETFKEYIPSLRSKNKISNIDAEISYLLEELKADTAQQSKTRIINMDMTSKQILNSNYIHPYIKKASLIDRVFNKQKEDRPIKVNEKYHSY